MAFQYLIAKLSMLPRIFSPTLDALLSTLPLSHRLRLLLLQPLNILAALLCAPDTLLTNRYSVIYIPTRSGRRRCLVFQPPRNRKTEPRPLHIDIHGGAWVGGLPEQNIRWCSRLSDATGAVVLSITYSLAPRHVYPAAHNDVDDAVSYLLSQPAASFGADPALLTVGGASVGANLALSASQFLLARGMPVPLACVAWYPVLEFRARPQDKKRPEGYPARDPLAVLVPLFDVYAGTKRAERWGDARLHPVLAGRESVPRDVLLVMAGMDTLLAEGEEFVERMRAESRGEERVEVVFVEKGFHGFMELPSFVLEKERLDAFDKSISFIKEAHGKAGFELDKDR